VIDSVWNVSSAAEQEEYVYVKRIDLKKGKERKGRKKKRGSTGCGRGAFFV
jgi:hypothetical protein